MLEDILINEEKKQKLISFINDNELDYIPVDNGIIKFHLIAADGIKFHIYENQNKWIIVKYDSNKDRSQSRSLPYEYFYYESFSAVLQQLEFYDKALPKVYWETNTNSIDIGFDINNYNDSWYDGILESNTNIKDEQQYKYLVYCDESCKPLMIASHNQLATMHNNPTLLNKLYFEVHPISCLDKNESYLLKLLCNNDEIFKEYVNYRVYKKKGLKLLIKDILEKYGKYKV
jgi:hypothetical protein